VVYFVIFLPLLGRIMISHTCWLAS